MIAQAVSRELDLLCEMTGYVPTRNLKGIALREGYDTVAVVGYDWWTPNSVQMHVWISTPAALTRKFIEECFRYPFLQAGRGLVVGVTPGDNARALNLNSKLGFRPVHRIKDGWAAGIDMVLQEMTREECRWLRRKEYACAPKAA